MRTTTPWAVLLFLGLGVLLETENTADTPGTSPTPTTPAARMSVTPQPQPPPKPTADPSSAVTMVPRPPAAVTVIDASSTRPAIEVARRPAAAMNSAIVPPLPAMKPASNADDGTEAIAAVIDSSDVQDTVSPLVRLYLAYFERVPDYEGLDYYIGQRERGRLLDDIADEFAGSREIGMRYGSLDNAAFVDRVFRNVFEGAGDAEQRASWVAQLESGAMTRGQMMLAFSESAAFRTTTANEVFVAMAYAEILGRMVPPAELARWVAFLEAGHTGEAVIQVLLAGR